MTDKERLEKKLIQQITENIKDIAEWESLIWHTKQENEVLFRRLEELNNGAKQLFKGCDVTKVRINGESFGYTIVTPKGTRIKGCDLYSLYINYSQHVEEGLA